MFAVLCCLRILRGKINVGARCAFLSGLCDLLLHLCEVFNEFNEQINENDDDDDDLLLFLHSHIALYYVRLPARSSSTVSDRLLSTGLRRCVTAAPSFSQSTSSGRGD